MFNGLHDDTHSAITDNGTPDPGREIKQGEVLKDHLGGSWTFIGITRVPNGASTGRVYVEGSGERAYKAEFFPSVFDLVIVKR